MFYFKCWKPIISVRKSCEESSLSSSFRARETAENCWDCQRCRLRLADRNAAFYFKRISEDWNSYLAFVGDVPFRIFAISDKSWKAGQFLFKLDDGRTFYFVDSGTVDKPWCNYHGYELGNILSILNILNQSVNIFTFEWNSEVL